MPKIKQRVLSAPRCTKKQEIQNKAAISRMKNIKK